MPIPGIEILHGYPIVHLHAGTIKKKKGKRETKGPTPAKKEQSRHLFLVLALVLLLKDDIPVVRLVENTASSVDAVNNSGAFAAKDLDSIDDVLHHELVTEAALRKKSG